MTNCQQIKKIKPSIEKILKRAMKGKYAISQRLFGKKSYFYYIIFKQVFAICPRWSETKTDSASNVFLPLNARSNEPI